MPFGIDDSNLQSALNSGASSFTGIANRILARKKDAANQAQYAKNKDIFNQAGEDVRQQYGQYTKEMNDISNQYGDQAKYQQDVDEKVAYYDRRKPEIDAYIAKMQPEVDKAGGVSTDKTYNYYRTFKETADKNNGMNMAKLGHQRTASENAAKSRYQAALDKLKKYGYTF